ncbi:hypothetical protein [Parapedobacter sp. 10938]|uniref:hypothetical protein n=1 Tax=Parapedobacter flavus TaxID=3110225 RepID=UPI002DB70A71|nr:hypothetical protein [Parapedobacter sp. 10938]MEC3879625.1 hypothetical protein [Parapedobacter sp. 10938]
MNRILLPTGDVHVADKDKKTKPIYRDAAIGPVFRTFVWSKKLPISDNRLNKTYMKQENKLGMALKEAADTSYLPVAWEYREVIEEAIEKKQTGKIFYFCRDEGVCEAAGKVIKLKEITKEGLFIVMDTAARIRVDRIITLYGKPGAAYDEYNAYGNACMDCLGGYDPDEL